MKPDVEPVKKRIRSIYETRRAQIYGLSLQYATMAWNYFKSQQPARTETQGKFWHNWTAQAALRVFSDAFMDSRSVGWFLSHGVDYGPYLELANDRKYESLRPIVQRYAGRFLADVKKLYAD